MVIRLTLSLKCLILLFSKEKVVVCPVLMISEPSEECLMLFCNLEQLWIIETQIYINDRIIPGLLLPTTQAFRQTVEKEIPDTRCIILKIIKGYLF